MIRTLTAAVGVTLGVTLSAMIVPPAYANAAPQQQCRTFWQWRNTDGDIWNFRQCRNGYVVVSRFGGPQGTCISRYRAGVKLPNPQRYTCNYTGPSNR